MRAAMIALQRAAATILAAVALPAVAAVDAPSSAARASAPGAPTLARSARFTQLGAPTALALRGDGASATLDFGSRSDEIIASATFRFRYVGSPALEPRASHIRLTLNGDPVGTLTFPEATAGTLTERTVQVDPRLLVGFNKLVMTLVASGDPASGDPARPGLWADVSASSELELVVQPLVLADDLAILPEPFFDRHDQRRVNVPFLFGAHPSIATLQPAAVVASWLGELAGWRGARMPVSFDAPSQGHAIAFATNDDRPAMLAGLPPAAGPELRLMTHPGDRRSRLLVIAGRDSRDLAIAARALVTSSRAMSGPRVQVNAIEDKGPLPPYEAPSWVPPDKPARLGDLVDSPRQLEASGPATRLEPVRVDVRAPPDLATWRGPGVPMLLKVQYTPTPCTTDAYLDVAVDDALLETLPLRVAKEPIIETKEAFIPFYRLRSRMELGFGFRFLVKDEGACRDAAATPVRAVVLPESTVDFSGFPHYVRMPNLAHFASIGFPFTRRADLSETVVVLPSKPSPADVETMLVMMARMGEATGQPATRVRVATPDDAAALADADLLVIGAPPQQALVERWSDRMPVTMSGAVRNVSQSAARLDGVFDWLGMAAPPDTSVATRVSFEGPGPSAALYGFESPLTRGRSVVAVTALAPEQLVRVVDALDDGNMRRAMKGSAAFVLPGRVESVIVGPAYYVGSLPPWTGAGYWISLHPEIAGFSITLVLAALGYAAYVAKRRVSAWRSRRRR